LRLNSVRGLAPVLDLIALFGLVTPIALPMIVPSVGSATPPRVPIASRRSSSIGTRTGPDDMRDRLPRSWRRAMPDVVNVDDLAGFEKLSRPSGKIEFDFACAAGLPGRQNRVRVKSDFARRYTVFVAKSPQRKIFLLPFFRKMCFTPRVPPRCRGAFRDRHEREVGCGWTQRSVRRALSGCGR
jgi:hypothetical protein